MTPASAAAGRRPAPGLQPRDELHLPVEGASIRPSCGAAGRRPPPSPIYNGRAAAAGQLGRSVRLNPAATASTASSLVSNGYMRTPIRTPECPTFCPHPWTQEKSAELAAFDKTERSATPLTLINGNLVQKSAPSPTGGQKRTALRTISKCKIASQNALALTSALSS